MMSSSQSISAIDLYEGWKPRAYQLPYFNAITQRKTKRAVIIWHRRAGKDLTSIQILKTMMLEDVGLYWHLLPTYKQGRKIVWDGFTGYGKRFTSLFPQELIKRKREDNMLIELVNGSIYQVIGTDDIDSLVGANPRGCIFSEYSLQNPMAWNFIRPILNENGGWATFIYTPRGRNHGYDLFERAKKEENYFTQLLTVDDTKKLLRSHDNQPILTPDGQKQYIPVVAPEMIEEDRRMGMSDEMIDQEYKCSFDAALSGSYYGPQLKVAQDEGRMAGVTHDPNLYVHTAWDIGISDYTAIWFIQIVGDPRAPREIRLIDYYYNNNENLDHYINELFNSKRDYRYGKHLAPHDIQKREWTSGKTRYATALKKGLKFTPVPRLAITDGIDACRRMLSLCYFNTLKTDIGLQSLREYRREYDEENKIFKEKPLKDWTNHGADAFRTLATGLEYLKDPLNMERKTVADSEYRKFKDIR